MEFRGVTRNGCLSLDLLVAIYEADCCYPVTIFCYLGLQNPSRLASQASEPFWARFTSRAQLNRVAVREVISSAHSKLLNLLVKRSFTLIA